MLYETIPDPSTSVSNLLLKDMTKITLTNLADLQRFVDEYQPSVEVVARIVEKKIKVWPELNAYTSSADLMAALRKHLEKYRGKEVPILI
jgi:hypothetical protein